MRQRRWLVAAVATGLLAGIAENRPFAQAPPSTSSPRVEQFTPQGVVKSVRQVTARFSEPMVPIGDPRPTRDPFQIACAEKGRARWVDSRNWAYDFARDLPAGVRCTFRLRDDLHALGGRAIVGARAFQFSTGGPAILRSIPYEGSMAIDEQQAFVLLLDAEPTPASVSANVSFTVEGMPQRVEARPVEGERRDAILKSLGRQAHKPAITLVIEAKQRFPNGAKVSLVWGRGVSAKSGVTTERDQVLPFQVRPSFTAEFHCGREHPKAACIPVMPMSVDFSASIARELAERIVLAGPGENRRTADAPTAAEPAVNRVVFRPPFPEHAQFRVELPPDLKDDAGRPLLNADRFPLEVRTAEFPPLAKFAARFGIVEWNADATLPVTLRNVEALLPARSAGIGTQGTGIASQVRALVDSVRGKVTRLSAAERDELLPWLHRVELARRDRSLFGGGAPAEPISREFTLPKPHGGGAFEVVGIPFTEPGLYVVELASPRLGASLLGKDQPMYVPTAVLVTNLSVHFKWGRENSLAWVTALDSAKPVGGASVAVQDCAGHVLWEGESDGEGIARIPSLPERESLPSCPSKEPRDDFESYESSQSEALRSLRSGLFVTARTANDLSFVGSGWDQGIEAWRFQLPAESWQGPLTAHTIFDRPLFRAGDEVHMKHVLRSRVLRGFAQVEEAKRPKTVSIRHLGSEDKYDLPLVWSDPGLAETTWKIPKEAKLGSYQVLLVQNDRLWSSGEFRVEAFRVPLMHAIVKPPAAPQIAVSEIPVDIGVAYLAGGGAGGLPVTLRWQIQPGGAPALEDFEGFTFGNGAVKPGIERRSAGELEDEEAEEEGAPTVPGRKPHVEKLTLTLDPAGAARATIRGIAPAEDVRELFTELEYRDPNGEAQTVSATTRLWPSRWLVGLKPDSWITSRERLKVSVVVVDTAGHPVAGAPVEVGLFEHKLYSNRTRLLGGFYAYEHVEETRRLDRFCNGVTDKQGLLICEGRPPAEGNLVLQASVTDLGGKVASAHEEVWVPGASQWWFRVKDSDRIDLLPLRRRYEPGETAHFQVRMPFPEATALVCVEREGILESWVQTLSGREPLVDVPVRASFAPNIFVSVMAVRGRVGDVAPTALVDLGRPSFKLGVSEIRVGWSAFELRVGVTAAASTVHVRDKVAVKIAVTTAEGKPPPGVSEVALAAVDEGLLELQPNRSWDLLEAMMGRRGYAIRNATAQGQVIGKRHYGLKALPQGGGGGRQITRELFDTLLVWKGRVKLSARGEATVDVPINDSLTSFKIVAVATSDVGLFGTGSTSIRSTQDLMLLSGIAPLVREGDEIQSEFTVRNTTERTMEVAVKGSVDSGASSLAPRSVSLAPGEAKVVEWPITAPAGVEKLRYEVDASEHGGAVDRLLIDQAVMPVVPVRTYQATLLRLEGEARQPVARPADAVPGRGGVRVTLAAKLTRSLEALREWMGEYPYSCLEQRVSRAIALRDEKLWQATVAAMPSHLDGDGLLKYFPGMQSGSEVLSAYVVSISRAAGWTLPEAVESRIVDGLTKFVDGRVRRNSALPTADLSIRKLAALEALSRLGKADAKLLASVTIEPNLWPTSALIDWWSLLARVAAIPEREARLAEVEQIVRSRLNLQGTSMGFSTEASDGLWWLMASTDGNAVRLVLLLVEQDRWHEDLPRLVQGALARQHRGAWCCTIANAWGTLAVEGFSKAFESTPVEGKTAASLAGGEQTLAWSEAAEGGNFFFRWPEGQNELALKHDGSGTPWVTLQAMSAIPLRVPLSSGYRFRRTVTPIEQRAKGRWSRGDLVRVRLDVEAQSDMSWVVVSDPIPAGASHLGGGLGRDSQLLTQDERAKGFAWPAFEERGADGFRAYYEFVPKGSFVVEHTLRLNQSGRFQMPSTRVEALYAPEMFGEAPNALVEVDP